MKTRFEGKEIDLKFVTTIGPIQKDVFRVYAGPTYSFSVYFASEYHMGVACREPMHFCSYDEAKLTAKREALRDQFMNWRH